MTTRNDIERVLWSACDSFRNKIDSSRYKDYILAMLFIKYLSDVYRETREKYIEEYNGNMARVDRAHPAVDEENSLLGAEYVFCRKHLCIKNLSIIEDPLNRRY